MLFACGYSASFIGAMQAVTARKKIALPAEVSITADAGIGPLPTAGFGIQVAMAVIIPCMDRDAAEALVAAHQACPYSNATRGNIDVTFTVV